jgi:hypothetical protein
MLNIFGIGLVDRSLKSRRNIGISFLLIAEKSLDARGAIRTRELLRNQALNFILSMA